jgi:DNA repair protein RecN (Recombination protein N)
MHRGAQRDLLDRHGGTSDRFAGVAGLHRQWQETCARIEALLGTDQDRESKLEFLRFQTSELDELELQEGEVETLHDELRRLANAGQLIDTGRRCLDTLYDADEFTAQQLLGRAQQDVATLARVDAALTPVTEALNNALIQIEDAVDRLRDYHAHLEQDPERLRQVEQRLDRLHTVARKHRVESETLPALAQRLRTELETLEQADTLLAGLEEERTRLLSDYRAHAKQLSGQRTRTADQLSAAVTDAMQTLGMKGGRFRIDVRHQPEAPPSPNGTDQVEFLVSANPGQPLQPLTRVASGGELSRISLAIQVIAARAVTIPTLIFDEVDSGVGGAVAETVGVQLRQLGRERQVLCVTHLPQVAAQADHHLQVTKLTGEETTRARIRELNDQERVEEIARMLGGRRITASTRAHAREMLGAAGHRPPAGKRSTAKVTGVKAV